LLVGCDYSIVDIEGHSGFVCGGCIVSWLSSQIGFIAINVFIYD